MSRLRQKPADKGSQKWLQLLVNRAPHLLHPALAGPLNFSATDKIVWVSPRTDDDYAEYRDEAFLSKVGAQVDRAPLSGFWPARGPQWDALGRTSRGEPLLVEAKAHIPELLSNGCQAAGRSLSVIRASDDATTGGPRTAEEWAGALRLVHAQLGIDDRRLEKTFGSTVIEIFIDTADIEAATL